MNRLTVVVLALAIGATPLYAQTVTVSGTVVDETGGVVPGATVEISDSRRRLSTATGPRGEFSFDVAPGTYELTVGLVGFAQATLNVSVGPGGTTVPAITLSPAGRTETVVVSASKTQSALIDAPATMSVISSDALASTPAQN